MDEVTGGGAARRVVRVVVILQRTLSPSVENQFQLIIRKLLKELRILLRIVMNN